MRKSLLSLVLLVISCLSTVAQEGSMQKFKSANKAYEEGNFQEAITAYSELLAEGYLSDDLHYNLGNAYFKENQIDFAILHYEKALKINPSNEDAAFNLKIANEKTIDKVEAIPDLFIYRWWKSIFNLFSANQWAKLMLTLFILALIGLGVYFFSRQLAMKKIGFYAAVTLIGLGLLSWFMAYKQKSYLDRIQFAIITTPTVNINSSPSPGSSKLFVLHEGTKVKIEDENESWYEVSLPNGNEGWIEKKMLVEI